MLLEPVKYVQCVNYPVTGISVVSGLNRVAKNPSDFLSSSGLFKIAVGFLVAFSHPSCRGKGGMSQFSVLRIWCCVLGPHQSLL